MKKQTTDKRSRLVVEKQTIRVLSDAKLQDVAGGEPTSTSRSMGTTCPTAPTGTC